MDSKNTVYISCGCNRSPHSMDWGVNDLICYGTCNSVAIYDPKEGGGGKVLLTLHGHTGRVNSLCWIRGNDNSNELVSVSVDKTGIVWTLKNGKFEKLFVLKGHTDAVTYVDAVYIDESNEEFIIATASVDSKVLVWLKDKFGTFKVLYEIDLKLSVCLVVNLTMLPGHKLPILIIGNDDSKIHIFSLEEKLIELEGHEDWIRALDSVNHKNGDVILASGSQDTSIRIWKFSIHSQEKKSNQFKLEEKSIEVDGIKWFITLESVLIGHEGWVYNIHWNPVLKKGGSWEDSGLLLSCSLDRTIALWGPEKESGVWLEQVRLGEVGGNALGYYGAKFSPQGTSILGYSFTGAFRKWHKEGDKWRSGVTVSGHFDSVEDIAWESQGRYLLSVSLDQTTRLHAPWVLGSSESGWPWHELCRPQIHGYDIYCLAMLKNHSFVSGAEEKVSRVFYAPTNVLENLNRITKLPLEDIVLKEQESHPRGAAVPALGLSNKAVYDDYEMSTECVDNTVDDYSGYSFTAANLDEPGTEDYLIQNSLWPEIMKLYGHGYEIFSLATTQKGDLLASACKATSTLHARIMLWDTRDWTKLEELEGHQLTITQMAFSPDDSYLLSVSRDRRWCLFKRKGKDKSFELIATTDKSSGIHSRIIWACSWTHNSSYFVTGSREGKVVAWGATGVESGKSIGQYAAINSPLQIDDSVTALSFAPCFITEDSSKYLLALGGEKGWIKLYYWSPLKKEEPWAFVFSVKENLCHQLTVKRLAFRPLMGRTGGYEENSKNILQLASCSQDHSVRVYEIDFNNFNM